MTSSSNKAATTKQPIAMQLLPVPRKGKSDWREYRPFRLDNGVTCMAVHDKESKTTAVTAAVLAGAAADPPELRGLAHFCEHMCFLGSTKYPVENEYKRYLATHGGRSNGSTSLHLTTYKFDVLANHAEKAVDIFANFFVSPLFTPSGTSREVQAVDSENSKNLTADVRRRLQILKALADPNHYYSTFTTGNAKTLPVDDNVDFVREALLAFHRHHYRPENLFVCIVGPQSLDTLQEWIVPRFSSIQVVPTTTVMERETETETADADRLIADAAKNMPNFAYNQPAPPFHSAFSKELQGGTWPVLLTIKPVKPIRKLTLNFPMPSTRYIADQDPVQVLGHLLGHEGKGSPFAALQNAGLLTSLSAGSRVSGPDQTLFQLDLALTKRGEEEWQTVVDLILAHCRLIHRTAVEAMQHPGGTADVQLRNIWGELAVLGAMHFDQTSPGAAYDFAPSLVQSIIKEGTAKCLSAGRMLDERPETFPLETFVDFSSRLTADNCIVERCSQAAWEEAEQKASNNDDDEVQQDRDKPGFGKQTEQWYGIDYYLSSIDPIVVKAWEGKPTSEPLSFDALDHSTLHLPGPNQFLPRTLELCDELPPEAKLGPRIEKEIDPPNLLVNEGGGRLWHRLDDRYALPKATLTFLLRNAAVENVLAYGTWQHNVDAAIHSSLLSGLFSQALKQETYDADLAGLSWSLSTSSAGIALQCAGYSDRLSDLALKVLKDFLVPEESEVGEDVIFKETYFHSVKDAIVRSLSNYFEAHRADVHAQYYRDLLTSSESNGIDSSLAAVEAATLDSVKEHHRRLLQNKEMEIECLYSGNVPESQARDFFDRASTIVREATEKSRVEEVNGAPVLSDSQTVDPCVPGPSEKRIPSGFDIELHFASKNPTEENGAVLVTYQSQIPGFKGELISTRQSLRSSACMRLICHMLREPLFNNLRTKQQLGYIVSSYYDLGFSCRVPSEASEGPLTVPIDFITINVLSRKVSPPEVKIRIDEFLESFRETLLTIPESEIKHHADALSKKLLKPIQKLGVEANGQFSKIRRYSPEVFANGGTAKDLPWNSKDDLANEIQSLGRDDLVESWDRMVTKNNRSRLVSCVYGSTFPLEDCLHSLPSNAIVNKVDDLITLRSGLKPFDSSLRAVERQGFAPLASFGSSAAASKTSLGLTAAAVMGAAVFGWSSSRRGKK